MPAAVWIPAFHKDENKVFQSVLFVVKDMQILYTKKAGIAIKRDYAIYFVKDIEALAV